MSKPRTTARGWQTVQKMLGNNVPVPTVNSGLEADPMELPL
jgi:hypothetical protein